MHDAYRDIMSRIAEPPTWWDINGTPRWDSPTVPLQLMGRVRCQACDRVFLVALCDNVYISEAIFNAAGDQVGGDWNLERDAEHLRLRTYWDYGDPPFHGCVGDTMNSVPEWDWGAK